MNEVCNCNTCKTEPVLEKLTKDNFENIIWNGHRFILHRKHLTLYRVNSIGKMKSDNDSWVKCVSYSPDNDYYTYYTRSIDSFIENFIPIVFADFEERLLDEKYQLCDKIDKLENFINENPKFKELSEDDKTLMGKQYDAMCIYLKCLEARVTKMLKAKNRRI